MGQSQSNQKPKPGDLIEISRGLYQHWAVYIGDGLVVHMGPPSEVAGAGVSSVMSVAAQRAVVKKEKLSEVVGTDDWKVNNDLDKKYNPHQTEIIVEEALQLVGYGHPYDIGTWNSEHFAKKLRYGRAESRQSDPTPKPGDLIEIFRGGYQHWAVYVGDDDIVHVTSPPGADVRRAASKTLMSVPTKKAMVKREKLKEVVGDNKWKINNILEKKYKPRSPDIIVEEALRQVGEIMEYSVTSKNCEHFATNLRYGQAESQQVQNTVAAHSVIVAKFFRSL